MTKLQLTDSFLKYHELIWLLSEDIYTNQRYWTKIKKTTEVLQWFLSKIYYLGFVLIHTEVS